MKNRSLNKADILLIIILLAAGISGVLMMHAAAGTQDAKYVCVSVNGSLSARYMLSDDVTETFSTPAGYNTIIISGGQVSVVDSDCKNHDCIKAGPISRCGEMLLCLPHRLCIEITGGDGYDAVS